MTYISDLKATNVKPDRIEAKLNMLLTDMQDRALAAATPAVPITQPAPILVQPLKPLDFSDRRLWDYNAKWSVSQWPNDNGPIPWKDDHVSNGKGDITLTLDGQGAPQLEAGEPYAYKSGLWEVEVTLPKFRDGVVVAPLWLWDKGKGIDEIDFEFAGRNGLDLTMHVDVAGQRVKDTVRLNLGDLSNTSHRFGIGITADAVTMLMDSKEVHHWDRSKMKQFVAKDRLFKAYIEMWGSYQNSEAWLGKFQPFTTGEHMDMIVHGYVYTPF